MQTAAIQEILMPDTRTTGNLNTVAKGEPSVKNRRHEIDKNDIEEPVEKSDAIESPKNTESEFEKELNSRLKEKEEKLASKTEKKQATEDEAGAVAVNPFQAEKPITKTTVEKTKASQAAAAQVAIKTKSDTETKQNKTNGIAQTQTQSPTQSSKAEKSGETKTAHANQAPKETPEKQPSGAQALDTPPKGQTAEEKESKTIVPKSENPSEITPKNSRQTTVETEKLEKTETLERPLKNQTLISSEQTAFQSKQDHPKTEIREPLPESASDQKAQKSVQPKNADSGNSANSDKQPSDQDFLKDAAIETKGTKESNKKAIQTEKESPLTIDSVSDQPAVAPTRAHTQQTGPETTPVSDIKSVKNVSADSAVSPLSPAQQVMKNLPDINTLNPRQIRITLNPEELGTVRIAFERNGDQIVGLIETQRPEVRRDIEQAMPQIITTLQQQGLQVRKVDVTMLNDAPQNKDQSGLMQDPSMQREFSQFSGNNTDRSGRYSENRSFSASEEYTKEYTPGTDQSSTYSGSGLNLYI